MANEIVEFEAGQIIFSEGDPGGSIYIIKKGAVEVFKNIDSNDIVLATLKDGEVLGILTFFSKGDRHASARAKTAVSCEVIEKSVLDQFKKLPKWVHVVLREFSIRLNQVNNMFVKTYSEYERAQVNSVDIFFVAEQLSAFAGVFGTQITELKDDEEVVSIDLLVNKAGEALRYSHKTLESVFDVFVDYSLVKAFMIEVNKPYCRKACMGKLKWFADFLKYKGHSGIELMLSEHLSLKQRRQVYLLHDFAKNKGLSQDQDAVFDMKTLEQEYESSVKFAFSKEAIEKAARIGLVNIVEKSNNKLTVSYNPLELSRSIVSLNVLMALHKIQEDMQKVAYRQVS